MNAGAHRLHGAVDLGDHAALDDAVLDKPRDLGHPDLMDEGLLVRRVAEQAPDVGEQDELFRVEGHRQLGRRGVGVDVVGGVRVHSLRHGGHHGDVAVFHAVEHRLGVHLGDLAHKAVFLVQTHRPDEPVVHAAQAHGPAALTVDEGHKVFVDLAAQHLLDDVHGLLIGIPQAVYKLGFLADLPEHIVDLRPTAVDHHHPDAHKGEQHDVGNDGPAQLLGHHGVAAVLDHDGFAAVFLNVGQGFGQHLRPVYQ